MYGKSQFKKDFKLITKRQKKLDKLQFIISELQHDRSLPSKNKNHKLRGNYADCWECHIETDWLLIYQMTSEALILIRTGTHADLF